MVGQKMEPQTHDNNSVKSIKKLFTGKFGVKWILKIPADLAYVATLPCKTLMSAKQAINNKIPGSEATCLGCGGIVSYQIRKGLLLSLSVNLFF